MHFLIIKLEKYKRISPKTIVSSRGHVCLQLLSAEYGKDKDYNNIKP